MNRWVRWLRDGLFRRRSEDDLREELASHQAMKEDELRDRGLPPGEAHAAARRALGSTALARDRARDVWVWPWLQDASRDLRLAMRLMTTHRGFAGAVITVLGLGIGIAILQFTLIDVICVRGLPIEGVDRVLHLSARDANGQDVALTYEEFERLQLRHVGIGSLTAFASAPGVVGDDLNAADRVLITYASAPLFDVLREHPHLGRVFRPSDDRAGATPVVVLAATYWASRYGSDPSVIGRTIRVNGAPATIIGVMAAPLRFPSVTDVWLPLSMMADLTASGRTARRLRVIGRLNEDATLPSVRTALTSAAAEWATVEPSRPGEPKLTAVPINERYTGRLTDPVWLAFGGIAIVILLSACANAANLLLMRGVQRGHEIGVRASIGASRFRLVRQLLVESAALGLAAGLCGVLLAAVALNAMNGIVPPNTLAYWMRFTVDMRAVLLALALSLASVLVFGLAPALHLARSDMRHLLRAGGLAGLERHRGRWATTTFLIVQYALTMVVLAALVVGVRGTREIGRRFAAIEPTNVLTTWVTLPADRYASMNSRRAFLERLEQRISELPGVSAVATATALPLGGASLRHLLFDPARHPADSQSPTVWSVAVSHAYFQTMGVSLVKGWGFAARAVGADDATSVIVNQRFVDLFLRGRDPLGQRLRLRDPSNSDALGPSMEIVGVAPSIRQRPQAVEAEPVVYVPIGQAAPSSAVVVIKASTRPGSLVAPVRSLVQRMDSELPLYRTQLMDAALAGALWNGRMSDALLNSIAVASAILVGIGLYGILSHAAAARRREMGIRIALGARPRQLMGLVARDAVRSLVLGLAAGVGCVYAFAALTGARADVVGYLDPTVLAAAGGLLVLVTVVASVGPAARAMRVDPVRTLRDA